MDGLGLCGPERDFMTLEQAMQWAEKNCQPESVKRLRSRAVVATLASELRNRMGTTIWTAMPSPEKMERADVRVSIAGAEAYLRAADSIDSGVSTKDLRAIAQAILCVCRKSAERPNVK